jgi:hypothetical protein
MSDKKHIQIPADDHRRIKLMAAQMGVTIPRVIHLGIVLLEDAKAPTPATPTPKPDLDMSTDQILADAGIDLGEGR